MWFFYMLPLAWLLQNVVHEASHLLFACGFHNRKPLGLWPYPHKYAGKFYFARSSWSGAPEKGKYDPLWLSPLLGTVVVAMSAGIVMLAYLGCPDVKYGASAFIMCAFVDTLWWVEGFLWGAPHRDGKRWRYGHERA